jgi:hypothetical protein
VGSVRGQVTDVPAIPTAGTAALLVTTTTALTESSTTSTSPAPDPTTTTTEGATSTSSTTTTTATPTPSMTSSTTTVPSVPSDTTYQLIGGQVTISALEPTVELVAAVPSAGFSAEIDEAGPEDVRVDFESSGHRSSFRARWENGELAIQLEEKPEDD